MTNATQPVGPNPSGSNAGRLYRVLTPDTAMTIGAWLLCMTGFLSLVTPSDVAASAIFRLCLVATGFALYGYGRAQKHREHAEKSAGSATEYFNGLHGWLILLGVMISISLIGSVIQAVSDMPRILAGKVWLEFTTPGRPAYDPNWGRLLMLDWGGNLLAVALLPVVLATFLQKRKVFPPVMIGTLVIFAVLAGLRVWLVGQIPSLQFHSQSATLLPVLFTAGQAAVWIPYLRISRRVKATFVK